MKTTKEMLEEHDKHCGCNEVHTNPEIYFDEDGDKLVEISKGCEFCGTKENCNNYYLGRKDAIDEINKLLEEQLECYPRYKLLEVLQRLNEK